MINAGLALGLAGLALATALIVYHGADAVLSAFAAAGFGILWVSLAHVPSMVLHARAWHVLFPGARKAPLSTIVWVNWIREGLNALLPLARVAGDVISIRLLAKHGVRTTPAVTTLVVDITLSLLIQYAVTVLGIVLLLSLADAGETSVQAVILVLASLPLFAGFLIAQRKGLFGLLARVLRAVLGERLRSLVMGTARLDRALRHSYRRLDRLARSCLWQIVGWAAGAAEVWLALYFLGHPVGYWDAFVLEAMTLAIVSAAFLVPGALGVQEGGLVVIGGLLGLPPDIALALSLMRRARDLILFVPALLAWQVAEGRWLLARRA